MTRFIKEKVRKLNTFVKRSSDFKILITVQGWFVVLGWVFLALFNYDSGSFNTDSWMYKIIVFLSLAVFANVVFVTLIKQLYGVKTDKEQSEDLIELRKAVFIAEDLFGLEQMFKVMNNKEQPDFHFSKDEAKIKLVNSIAQTKSRNGYKFNPFHEEQGTLRDAAVLGHKYWDEDNN